MSLVSEYGVALLGGGLIGLAATGLLYSHGRLAGISGILANVLQRGAPRAEWTWRVGFLLGLLAIGLVFSFVRPEAFAAPMPGFGLLAVAGLLAGFGSRLGSGCTSGHGICGIGTGSVRSIVATGIFMVFGALAVVAARQLLGGGA